mgnify:CR=1 FL=1
MFKRRVLVTILSSLLVFLIVLLFEVDNPNSGMFTRMIKVSTDKSSYYVEDDMEIVEVNTNEEHSHDGEQDNGSIQEVTKEDETSTVTNMSNKSLANLNIVVAVRSRKVYDCLTMDELASKLERSLKNELSGKGYLYASYSLEKGVDPYLAVAISLEETGCNWNCSKLVKTCNNVGGMKGSGCGSYGAFPTLDDGIKAFIDNIYKNYVAYGLTTADTMNPKYAENPAWSTNVNRYITKIKNS